MKNYSYILRAIIVLLMACMALVFAGCKSKAPAIPTNVHENTSDNTRIEYRTDTCYRDRWHTEYMRGDTCFIHDSIDRWKIREVYIHDSIDNSRIDTICQKVEVEKEYSAFLVKSGVAFWILLVLVVLGVIAGIIFKFAK